MQRSNSGQSNIIFGYFYNLNYALGTGFLSLPFTFYYAGIIPSFLALTVLSVCSYIASVWILETMARANALNLINADKEEFRTQCSNNRSAYYISETRKFEVTEISEILFGLPGKLFTLTVLSLYCTIAIWSYASVAASAWSINIPVNTSVLSECSQTDFTLKYFPTNQRCFNLYRVCLSVFGILVITLSSLELNEQKYIQASFAVLRFIALTSILIFSTFIIIHNKYNPNHPMPLTLNNTNSTVTQLLSRFDIIKWFVALPIITYALNLTNGIPALTHHIVPKERLKQMYTAVYLTIWFFYATIGVLVSIAFLNLVNENAALDWNYFTQYPYSIIARIFSYFIILFPSLDVISIYPLYVTTLSNNFYLAVMCRDTSQGKFSWKDKMGKLAFRLIFAIIPLIGAAFISNLVTLLQLAGLFVAILQFFIPASCQWQSKRLCGKQIDSIHIVNNRTPLLRDNSAGTNSLLRTVSPVDNGAPLQQQQQQKGIILSIRDFLFKVEAKTPYSGWYSSNAVIIIVSVVGLTCFCLTIVSIL